MPDTKKLTAVDRRRKQQQVAVEQHIPFMSMLCKPPQAMKTIEMMLMMAERPDDLHIVFTTNKKYDGNLFSARAGSKFSIKAAKTIKSLLDEEAPVKAKEVAGGASSNEDRSGAEADPVIAEEQGPSDDDPWLSICDPEIWQQPKLAKPHLLHSGALQSSNDEMVVFEAFGKIVDKEESRRLIVALANDKQARRVAEILYKLDVNTFFGDVDGHQRRIHVYVEKADISYPQVLDHFLRHLHTKRESLLQKMDLLLATAAPARLFDWVGAFRMVHNTLPTLSYKELSEMRWTHVPVRPQAKMCDQIEAMLKRLKELKESPCGGDYLFVPGLHTIKSHSVVAKTLGDHGIITLIVNGQGCQLYLPEQAGPFQTIGCTRRGRRCEEGSVDKSFCKTCNPKFTVCEIIKRVKEEYVPADKAFAVTGHLCLRDVTIQHSEDLPFTKALFVHDVGSGLWQSEELNKACLYYLCGRVTFTPPLPARHAAASHEQCAQHVQGMQEAQVVDQDCKTGVHSDRTVHIVTTDLGLQQEAHAADALHRSLQQLWTDTRELTAEKFKEVLDQTRQEVRESWLHTYLQIPAPDVQNKDSILDWRSRSGYGIGAAKAINAMNLANHAKLLCAIGIVTSWDPECEFDVEDIRRDIDLDSQDSHTGDMRNLVEAGLVKRATHATTKVTDTSTSAGPETEGATRDGASPSDVHCLTEEGLERAEELFKQVYGPAME